MDKLIFWGATGQSIVLEEFLSKQYEVIALFDNDTKVLSPFKGVPIYYGKKTALEWLAEHKDREINFVVSIAGDKSEARTSISEFLMENGLKPLKAIHPTSFVADSVDLGQGVQILAQAAVCARVKLGQFVIINTSASVDHECELANGVHIGPGAKLAGCVKIGTNSFIGTGAIILPRIRIGANVIVGAGAVVTKDLPDNVIARGNPAKIVRENDK